MMESSADAVQNESGIMTCRGVDSTTGLGLRIATIVFAVLILAGLSFTYRRKRFQKHVLWGLPGIAVPVNLLTNAPRRYISVLIFAIMSGDILEFFFSPHGFLDFSGLTSSCYALAFLQAVVSPLLLISYVSIKFFPLLACLGVVTPVLGPCLGLLYSVLLFTYNTYTDFLQFYCADDPPRGEILAIYLALRLPLYVTSFFIFIWFLVSTISSIVTFCQKGSFKARLINEEEITGSAYYTRCVKHLLKRPKATVRKDTVTYKIIASVLPFWLSPRRMPLKFLAAMAITFFMIYQFGLLLFSIILDRLVAMVSLIKGHKESIVNSLAGLFNSSDDTERYYELILELSQGLAVVIPAAPVISAFICFLLLFHLHVTVYKNMVEASRGKYNFIKLWPTVKLSYSWRYPGYQIAFTFTAFLLYVVWLTLFGMGALFLYNLFKYYAERTLCTLAYILMPTFWVAVVVVSQLSLAKLAFIADSTGKFPAFLTNHRVLHWVAYFLFIYDAINGLVTAILRLLFSQVFGLLLMIRLDRVILVKGFEWYDFGHKAYMAFLHFNHAYNNPVVHTFVRLMLDSSPYRRNSTTATPTLDIRVKLLDDFDSTKSYGVSERKRIQFVPTRVRNRWFVVYTLLRNPSLQQYRASSLRGNTTTTTTTTGNTNNTTATAVAAAATVASNIAADDSVGMEETALKLSSINCQ